MFRQNESRATDGDRPSHATQLRKPARLRTSSSVRSWTQRNQPRKVTRRCNQSAADLVVAVLFDATQPAANLRVAAPSGAAGTRLRSGDKQPSQPLTSFISRGVDGGRLGLDRQRKIVSPTAVATTAAMTDNSTACRRVGRESDGAARSAMTATAITIGPVSRPGTPTA